MLDHINNMCKKPVRTNSRTPPRVSPRDGPSRRQPSGLSQSLNTLSLQQSDGKRRNKINEVNRKLGQSPRTHDYSTGETEYSELLISLEKCANNMIGLPVSVKKRKSRIHKFALSHEDENSSIKRSPQSSKVVVGPTNLAPARCKIDHSVQGA